MSLTASQTCHVSSPVQIELYNWISRQYRPIVFYHGNVIIPVFIHNARNSDFLAITVRDWASRFKLKVWNLPPIDTLLNSFQDVFLFANSLEMTIIGSFWRILRNSLKSFWKCVEVFSVKMCHEINNYFFILLIYFIMLVT